MGLTDWLLIITAQSTSKVYHDETQVIESEICMAVYVSTSFYVWRRFGEEEKQNSITGTVEIRQTYLVAVGEESMQSYILTHSRPIP